jgi:hypothetical protein
LASLALAFLSLSLPFPAPAQYGVNAFYRPATAPGGQNIVIPPGTTIEGRLQSTIGSSASRQGQSFAIEITSPLLANGSDVLIPAGAEILGEVAEAIPAHDVPHLKGQKPLGKLRVQITTLKMPSGMTYPLVASIVGEKPKRGTSTNPELGGGVAYQGSQNSFESVSAQRMYGAQRKRNGPPHVVTRNELMSDPIYGKGNVVQSRGQDYFQIRSMVIRKRDLYIYQGSPISLRLDAAFKFGVETNQSNPTLINPPSAPSAGLDGYRHRFSREPAPQENEAPPASGPSGGATSTNPQSNAPAPASINSVIPNNPLPFQVPPGRPQSSGSQGGDANF